MPSNICNICDQSMQDGWCSEFCVETSAAEKSKLLQAKPGDVILWPCPECGCVVHDEYIPPTELRGCCGGCWPRRALREAKNVLSGCIKHLPHDHAAVVQGFLDKFND